MGIKSEIFVDDHVPESGDLTPLNHRMRIPELARKMLHDFAQDFQVTQDGIIGSFISKELFAGNA